jgi:hypothetical protein
MNGKKFFWTFFLGASIIIGTKVSLMIHMRTSFPPPIYHRISTDAKTWFLSSIKEKDSFKHAILGSSLGLNNLDGNTLEEKLNEKVINFSSWGLTPKQTHQLSSVYLKYFDSIENITIVVQTLDFFTDDSLDDDDLTLMDHYFKHSFSSQVNFYWKLLPRFRTQFKYWLNYNKNHMNPSRYQFLGFDNTGSVPLHIPQGNISNHRFNTPHQNLLKKDSFLTLRNLISFLKDEKALNVNILISPYRNKVIEKSETLSAQNEFSRKEILEISHEFGIDVYDSQQDFGDKDHLFVDRSHLNPSGSKLLTIAYVDKLYSQREDAGEL